MTGYKLCLESFHQIAILEVPLALLRGSHFYIRRSQLYLNAIQSRAPDRVWCYSAPTIKKHDLSLVKNSHQHYLSWLDPSLNTTGEEKPGSRLTVKCTHNTSPPKKHAYSFTKSKKVKLTPNLWEKSSKFHSQSTCKGNMTQSSSNGTRSLKQALPPRHQSPDTQIAMALPIRYLHREFLSLP